MSALPTTLGKYPPPLVALREGDRFGCHAPDHSSVEGMNGGSLRWVSNKVASGLICQMSLLTVQCNPGPSSLHFRCRSLHVRLLRSRVLIWCDRSGSRL